MKTKKYNQFLLIRTREEALTFFRSKRAYYDKKTGLYLCQGDNCGRKLTETQVIDDHINNDNTDNRLSNHQPLCKSCNTHNSGKTETQMKRIARQRRKALDNGLSKSTGISAQMIVNKMAEQPFRDWCIEKVGLYGSISWADLIDAGCEYITQNHIGLNQATADRYLRKLTSFEGPLLVASGMGDARMIELRDKRKQPSENSSGPS